jgi:hypothetical protein
MARIIPSFVDEHTPPGERDVFNTLAAGPNDWIALHSLDLAPWNRDLRTEVDFVLIIPDTGILCIEVKSHLDITFDGCRWHPPEIKRSPFKQAADGRFAFYRRMRDLAPRFAGVPVVHCCIFPRARFDVTPNLSVQPWELMDMRAFRALNDSGAFCADLRARLTRSIQAEANLRPLPTALTAADVAAMVEACVPVQKRRPDAREEVRRREEQAASILREQQKPVLRLAELNDRLIVSGGAGTGKTLIAMEIATRAAERGRRVALLCYNQLVGDWMRQRIAQTGLIPPNLIIGRAIRVMAEMTGVVIPEAPSPSFWETELPEQLEDRLTDPELKATSAFDYLVLDEAQDILARPRLWTCLLQFLRGGINAGEFAILGDFDHQVLRDHEPMRKTLAILDVSARPVRWHLAENCRNYRIVGETALRLGGVPATVYSGYLRPGGGLQNYDIRFYENNESQLAQLAQWLRDFKTQGYRASDVTLLSFRSDEVSAATSLKHAGHKLRPAWLSGDATAYASVHAFKGMENKIIMLTDVILTDHDFQRDLFYTGMTRATECVRVLCDKRSEAILCGWLAGKADI